MRRRFAFIPLLFLTSFSSSSSLFAFDGPSFDCSHGVRQTLAAILCSVPEAAQADWDLNNAYWPLYSDDREETAFVQNVNKRCALPALESGQEQAGRMLLQGLGSAMLGTQLPFPGPRTVTLTHVRCVIDAFRNRASLMRSKLTDDALAESNLSPEEHISIQEALTQKGFMQNRVKGYGANADGQFGPNTRSAITDFQRSIGAQATGFLTESQRLSLTETPEERRARDSRAAAEEKSRLEALQTQKVTEERKQQEAINRETERVAALEAAKHAEEKAKQDATDREKRRLEEEAAKAAEWRGKIEEAQRKGVEYAKANDLSWSLAEKSNPMTDDKDYEVSSTQTNDSGAVALVQGRCLNDELRFEAVLHDASDPKVPLGLPGSSLGGLVGKKRINDAVAFANNFPLDQFRNRIVLTQQSFKQDDPESADTTWRVLAEIETSQGTLYIKVPMLDPKIQKLLAACKRQSVVNQRRQSSPG
jgi:peptidoglycan hydrolase-like protein with peptidoglycan-binding domain